MKLSLVVPCFNEQQVLQETVRRLLDVLHSLEAKGDISAASDIWLVDDGSTDATWSMIEALAANSTRIVGLKLSRNRGHQNALLAGLLSADGDAVISLDADLQDDLGAVESMIRAYQSGCEIVYGVRSSRTRDTWLKRWTAEKYYAFLARLGADVVQNHADYRLLSRKALEALRGYGEVNLFLRGIIPQLGFKSEYVYYERGERFAGESKYPLRKMLALAVDGITSFSPAPLRLIALTGAVVFFITTCVAGWILAVRLFSDAAVPGWASTTLPVYALGGLQLFCTGIVGEYVAKVYMETKQRPRFLIEKVVGRPGQCERTEQNQVQPVHHAAHSSVLPGQR